MRTYLGLLIFRIYRIIIANYCKLLPPDGYVDVNQLDLRDARIFRGRVLQEVSYEENIMHAFWLRFAVTLGTTFVWSFIGIRMSMYGMTVSMLCAMGVFIAISAVAWFGSVKQLIMDSNFSVVFNSLSEDIFSGKDMPW